MVEKKSIGYIPPTPFRDDSDVFLLPPDEDAESGNDEGDSVWMAQELQSIHALRQQVRQRREEIAQRFQQLLSQSNQVAVSTSTTPTPIPQAPPAPRTAPVVPRRTTAPPSASTADRVPPPEPEPGQQAPDGTDRLAALKAQLASRIRAFQSSTQGSAPTASEGSES